MRSIINSESLKPQMKQAIESEARKMVAQQAYSLARDLVAIMLYTLHTEHGWGRTRLLRFYFKVMPLVQGLKDHYEMQDSEAAAFLCRVKLKDETGIDLETIDMIDDIEVSIK